MAKLGRPKLDTEPVTIRMDRQMLKAIDDYRRLQEDLPSRPEVVRSVMTEWLATRADGEVEGARSA
jgi:Arc/MetJ-type ribon-helix-helix transcriptional regulator